LRWSSAQAFGVDYPWYFQAGVANQYVLGAGLQPSTFGVFLLLSVHAFLRARPRLAVTWSALAVAMHPTYLLTAAFLTLSYLYVLYREKRVREACVVVLLALVLVLPVAIHNLIAFAPTSPEAFAEAKCLLAHYRIPHHAQPQRWFDGIAVAQVAWICWAMVLSRGTRLFPILLLPFILSCTLTFVQIGTGSDALALLFPWRTSVILMPLATTVILGRLVNVLLLRYGQLSVRTERALKGACVVALVTVVLSGATITWMGVGYRTNADEFELLKFVQAHQTPDDTYLLPVEVPKLSSGRTGAASLNFTPPPKRGEQHQNISVDLQRFRLFTGVPIFVDFKSIPYKDTDVLEWHRCVLWNQRIYERGNWNKGELAAHGITHVVTTADRKIDDPAFELMHEDTIYRVYRIRTAPEK
jgi:hypothetical protein